MHDNYTINIIIGRVIFLLKFLLYSSNLYNILYILHKLYLIATNSKPERYKYTHLWQLL